MLMCLLLCGALRALSARGFLLEESCPRKEPPPGVVVLHPGSRLVLSCSGWVMVDGVRVPVTREHVGPTTHHNDVTRERVDPTTHNNDVTRERADPTTHHNDVSLFPTQRPTHTPPTPVDNNTEATAFHVADNTVSNEQLEWQQHRRGQSGHTPPPTDQYDWSQDHQDLEEDKGGDLRVTRAVPSARPQWRRNGRLVTAGGKRGGGGGERVQFLRRGSILALAAVTATDGGKYSCHHHHHRQGDNFSVRIHVAGPPEQPILQCYKRSPSSKIRCGWTPQRPGSAQTSCSLLLYKGLEAKASRTECSYSSRVSRWWCTVEHTEDELRTLHRAALCVSSLAGSSVSRMLDISPMDILKPDPPSNVTLWQEEGQERRLRVTWGPPLSWKGHDNYYVLKYELLYRPLQSTLNSVVEIPGEKVYWQVKRHDCYTITDALPGVQYSVQLRAKDEWEGHWSDWNAPVYGHTWTAQTSTVLSTDDLSITMYPFYEVEGSGIQEAVHNGGEQSNSAEVVWYHVLLAASSCVILLVALAAYTIRRVGLALPCAIHKPPSSPTSTFSAPQGALFPPRYKQTLPDEEEEQRERGAEEDDNGEETRALHFDNSSYFLVRS